MPDTIRSARNERVRWLSRLGRDRRFRRSQGVWVAEGIRLAEEVLASGLRARLWLLEPGWEHEGDRAGRIVERALARGDPVVRASRAVVRRAACTETPQGVVVAFEAPRWSADDLLARPGPLLVLDRIQDPGNLGTLARTAEATGAAGLLLVRGTADPSNPKALRASAGSLLRVPTVAVEDAEGFLGEHGIPPAATVRRGGVAPDQADLTGRFALLLGQEGGGLSPRLERTAALRITLPMEGAVESLNVAAAAAMILYEAQRQRRTRHGPARR